MKKTYSEKLRDPRWQKVRLEVMNRDKFTCKMCGDTETTLNVHHKQYGIGLDPWEYPLDNLITVCEHCHYEIEFAKRRERTINSIYKSNGWSNNTRIMFISDFEYIYMRIYDQHDNYIAGYNLSEDIQDINKLISRHKKLKKHG